MCKVAQIQSKVRLVSSVGRASDSRPEGRGFKSLTGQFLDQVSRCSILIGRALESSTHLFARIQIILLLNTKYC